MKVLFGIVCLAVIAMSYSVYGLECYSCIGCSNPSGLKNCSMAETSCSYTTAKLFGSTIVTRACSASCSDGEILGIKTTCCNTDGCNSAPSTITGIISMVIPVISAIYFLS